MLSHIPEILATENAEWEHPISKVVTHVAVNKGTSITPDYQWVRKSSFSVYRPYTPDDEIRLATALFNANTALGKIVKGTVEQLLITNALFFICEDPDSDLNARYGGGYINRNNNMYKIEFYNSAITLDDLINDIDTSIDTNPDTNPTTPTTPTTDSTDVGNFGISVKGNEIIMPADGYYQIQDVATQLGVFEGEGGTSHTVVNGQYNIINLTTGARTEKIDIPLGSSSVNPGNGDDTTNQTQTYTIGDFGLTLQGNVLKINNQDYWQVQRDDTFVTIFEGNGPQQITLSNGRYNAINLLTGDRTNDIEIPYDTEDTSVSVSGNTGDSGEGTQIGSLDITLIGSTVSIGNSDYYQIQESGTTNIIWEGNGPRNNLVLPNNTYDFVNTTTQVRVDDFVVPIGSVSDGGYYPVGDFGVMVRDNKVKLPYSDYYQVQNRATQESSFEGVGPITVSVLDGSYNIINHTANLRINTVVFPYEP